MQEVTRVLSAIEQGDPGAAEELLPLVYEELRRLALDKLAREKPGQTLQATALVHEAYLRLVDVEKARHWKSRAHFFAAAAEAMRRILVENARRKRSRKAGGGWQRIELGETHGAIPGPTWDLLLLDEALEKLSAVAPRKARLVQLRFFAGLPMREVAEMLGISTSTAYEDWTYAKCWLRLEMTRLAESPPPEPDSSEKS